MTSVLLFLAFFFLKLNLAMAGPCAPIFDEFYCNPESAFDEQLKPVGRKGLCPFDLHLAQSRSLGWAYAGDV